MFYKYFFEGEKVKTFWFIKVLKREFEIVCFCVAIFHNSEIGNFQKIVVLVPDKLLLKSN